MGSSFGPAGLVQICAPRCTGGSVPWCWPPASSAGGKFGGCDAWETCDGLRCQPKTCAVTGADCGTHDGVCLGTGICARRVCEGDNDCLTGSYCVEGECQTAPSKCASQTGGGGGKPSGSAGFGSAGSPGDNPS